MGIIHCTAILAAISIPWLPTSCAKSTSTAKTAPPATAVAANPNQKDMGQVMLTNHFETCVDIGNGKSCVIRPRLYDAKTVQLTMELQSTNEDGATDSLSVAQVVTKPGKPFEFALGDMTLIMTPVVAQ